MINHEQKYIFIHIPKVCGNSIKVALGLSSLRGDHSGIWQKPSEYLDYYKFSFVRNPWDRLISAYYFLKAGGISQYDPNRSSADDDYYCHVINTKFPTVDDFIRCAHWWRWKHLREQYSYISIDGIPAMDFIGRRENLQEDFNIVCDKIGIPRPLKAVSSA